MNRPRFDHGLAMMLAFAATVGHKYPGMGNFPEPDENIINPPQSEESKQFYLKRAEEKRQRRLNKRKDLG